MENKKNKKNKPISTELVSPEKLKLLFTIVNRSKVEFYIDLLETNHVNMNTVVYAKGTAPSSVLEVLATGDQPKVIILSVVKESNIDKIMELLNERFKKIKNGKGIAFTVAMSSIIGIAAYKFLSNQEG